MGTSESARTSGSYFDCSQRVARTAPANLQGPICLGPGYTWEVKGDVTILSIYLALTARTFLYFPSTVRVPSILRCSFSTLPQSAGVRAGAVKGNRIAVVEVH